MAGLIETMTELNRSSGLVSEAKEKSRQYATLSRVYQLLSDRSVDSEVLKELGIPEKIEQLGEELNKLKGYLPYVPRQPITQDPNTFNFNRLSSFPQGSFSDTLIGVLPETSFDEFRENNPYHPIVRAHGLIEDVLSGNFDGVPKPNPVIAELVNKSIGLSHKVGYIFTCFR